MPADSPDVVLSVKNVSKCFEMYEKPVHRLYQTLCAGKKRFYREFWALSDISFDVRRGECVGIIGRNGAGKSTLLQIVTGTLSPSRGSVEKRGRVAALLELGSGFNPEFTGRENVYLNGSILGLSKAEIDARYDDIIAFADIGDFVDRPVKTYSSGMAVRLAFAVNAHVDADILIVDEALSVGDVRFQQKCLRKINDLIAAGTTILFVTHDIGAVARFCGRSLWLDRGRIVGLGPSDEVVRNYLAFMQDGEMEIKTVPGKAAEVPKRTASADLPWHSTSPCQNYGEKGVEIVSCCLTYAESAEEAVKLKGGERVALHMALEAKRDIRVPNLGFTMKDRFGTIILESNTMVAGCKVDPIVAGESRQVALVFDFPYIRNGEFTLSVAVAEGTMGAYVQHHWVHDALVVMVDNRSPSRELGSLLFADDMICVKE